MRLVAFTGNMGVGKSEAVKVLTSRNQAVVLCKFAETLYDIQEYIYLKISTVYKRPESFVKDRKLLQFLGTEWGRDSISASLWIDLWKAKTSELLTNHNTIIVCDDLRFDNEAEAVKSLGGYIIKIESNRSSSRIDTSGAKHSSELGISNKYVDHTLHNNDSIEEYKNKLTSLFSSIML